MSDFETKQYKYDMLYLDIAERVARMSFAKRAKVGCVIVKDGRILSMGWNGMPTGFDNNCEFEFEGKLVTYDEVVHAESNALMKLAQSTDSSKGATAYCTLSVCIHCAKLLHQAGIKRLVFNRYHTSGDPKQGEEFLRKCGVVVEYMPDNLPQTLVQKLNSKE